jgi:hypothetical protein
VPVDHHDPWDALPANVRGHDRVGLEALAGGHDHRIGQLEPAGRPQLGGQPCDRRRELDDPDLAGEALDDLHRPSTNPQRTHEDLRIGERRDGEGMPIPFGPDGLAGDLMERVVAVQGADHDRRVEQRYSHSPRSSSR